MFAAKTFLLFAQSVAEASQVAKLVSYSTVATAMLFVCQIWGEARFHVFSCSSEVNLAVL